MKTTDQRGLYFSVFMLTLCFYGIYYGMKNSYEIFCVSFVGGIIFFSFILSYANDKKIVEAKET